MEIRYGMAFPEDPERFRLPDGDKVDWLDLFSQLFLRTDGDLEKTLEWLRRLAEKHGLLGRDMTFEDVLDELERRGVIQRDRGTESPGGFSMTPRGERAVRENVFERVFKGLGKGFKGSHATGRTGQGGERLPETRPDFRNGE